MTQSFDWGEQVFPVPAVVLWHATKLAIEQSGQQNQGVDDFTMLATVKEGLKTGVMPVSHDLILQVATIIDQAKEISIR